MISPYILILNMSLAFFLFLFIFLTFLFVPKNQNAYSCLHFHKINFLYSATSEYNKLEAFTSASIKKFYIQCRNQFIQVTARHAQFQERLLKDLNQGKYSKRRCSAKCDL